MEWLRYTGTMLTMILGSFLVAFGFNRLLIPFELLSGGVSGISMMIGYITGGNIGWLYFVLNFPILVWGLFTLGKRFILWSIISVITATAWLQFIPVKQVVGDPLLGAIFGGVIVGLGSGLALRKGGSSGGFDIIASIVTRKRDLPVGMIIFLLNGIVILVLGWLIQDWDSAMYSMISIFAAGKVVDIIHIRYVKVTAFIITKETDKLKKKLLERPRGVTVIRTRGAYSGDEKDMLMTVTTRYELAELRKTILSLDPSAFVSIVETVGVLGQFRQPVG
ncbi:YitT family protein [Paenibacillus sp. GCM10012307]|uniref:YitT family protein n=1 Tax=Paenibacillus roseus TaxID=2798579 RepID=A0A934J1H5_9BACL|nr:YitT family protein [Paenibacillus roseus]MBJ6359839.1 YitT family protein [Paenibacillus roseus]